jgi:hypothetical protein
MTKKPKLTSAEKQLDDQLNTLQDSCYQELRMFYANQQQERENLAKIYYWWQVAYKIPDYYNAKLAHLPQEQQRKTSAKFNFAPVLRLFYGVNALGDSKRSRMSGALNAIHEEWQSKPKLYKQDVSKLANYIDQNNGVTGLYKQQVKISPATIPNADIQTDIALDEYETKQEAQQAQFVNDYEYVSKRVKLIGTTKRIRLEVTDAQRKEALSEAAEKYWRKANGITDFDLTFGVETNKRKYSLALLHIDGEKFTVIDTNVDETAIKSALLSSYRKQYAVVPQSLRCLVETLRTQYLGGKIRRQLEKTLELGLDKNAQGELVYARKRLVLCPVNNQILLSPISSKAGVVTIATPNTQLIKSINNDFYMPVYSRSFLERRLIENDDINQFDVSSPNSIKPYNITPSIIYGMKLTNKAMPADFAYIDILPFVSGDSLNYSQVTVNAPYISAIKSKHKINAATMHKLAQQYANKWLDGKGDHSNRPENTLCSFTVTSTYFQFEIFEKSGDVGADPVCTIGKKLKITKPYKQYFKCKDLMPVLSGIGALQLDGDVEILLDSNVLIFKYKTTASSYITAIPTCIKATNERNAKAFIAFQPVPYSKPLRNNQDEIDAYFESKFDDYNELVLDDDLIPVYAYED